MNNQHRQDLAFLKAAPQRQSQLGRNYRATIAAIHAEARYLPPAEYQRQLARARAEQDRQITRLRADCISARERLERAAEYAKGAAGRSDDAAQAVLAQAAWQRIKPVVARQGAYGETVAWLRARIAQAGREGDTATLRAFRAELPDYLEAIEHPAALAERRRVGKSFQEADGTLRALLADVDRAAAPHLSAEERAASEIEAAIQPYEASIGANFARLELSLSNPSDLGTVGLIGWPDANGQPTYIKPDGAEEAPQQPGNSAASSAAPLAPGSMRAFQAFPNDDD